MTTKTSRTIAVAAATICTFMIAPAVHASTADLPDAPTHCTVEVSTVGTGQPQAEPVCFETPAEVDEYLESLRSPSARAALVDVVLGVTYSDANGGGSSLTYWGSSGCAGVTFGFSTMPSGWSNNVSSASGSNGCWVTLYSTTGYGGSRLTCTPWCGSVGGLNDAVKSLVFRPQGTFG